MRTLLLIGSVVAVLLAAQARAEDLPEAPNAPEEETPTDPAPPALEGEPEPTEEEGPASTEEAEAPTAGDEAVSNETDPEDAVETEPQDAVEEELSTDAVPETSEPAEPRAENEMEALPAPNRRSSRAQNKPSGRNCLAPPVWIARAEGERRELRRLSLTDCEGKPNLDAIDQLSILARPHGVDRPAVEDDRPSRNAARRARRLGPNVAPNIRRVHPGLLTRLQNVAERWPGRRIEIVSGYRPQARRTSRHHHGAALDVRVVGVSKEALTRFARSMEATGVGYYPNSSFTHIDVRTESAYWVDRSTAGQPADYGAWPPADKAQADTCQADLAAAVARIAELTERLEAAAIKLDASPNDTSGVPLPAPQPTEPVEPAEPPSEPIAPVEGEIPTIDWTPPADFSAPAHEPAPAAAEAQPTDETSREQEQGQEQGEAPAGEEAQGDETSTSSE